MYLLFILLLNLLRLVKYNSFQRIRLKIKFHIFWHLYSPKEMRNHLELRGLFRDFPIILALPKYFAPLSFPFPQYPLILSQIRYSWTAKISFRHLLCGKRMENGLLVRFELLAAAVLATIRGDFELNVWLLKVFGFGV